MTEIGHDVKIEPELSHIEDTADKARLGVSGVGASGTYGKTFLEIRIIIIITFKKGF